MSRIVFRVFPGISHYNASFYLASKLVARGHEVVYAVTGNYDNLIKLYGYKFFKLNKEIVPVLNSKTDRKKRFIRSKFTRLRLLLEKTKSFEEIVNKINPDCIIIDNPLIRYSLILNKLKIPYLSMECMISVNKCKNIPPITSTYVPQDNLLSHLYCNFLWKIYFVKRRYSEFIYQLFGGASLYDTYKILLRWSNISYKNVNFQRALNLGIKTQPELILSPEEFDYPFKKNTSNQFYIGPTHIDRKEENYDWKYKNIFSIINKRKIVFCSLGSINIYYYKNSLNFLKKIISIFSELMNYHLIMATGEAIDIKSFSNYVSNISIYQIVPQQEIISYSDLVITHGGIGTITDSILNETPLLVYPTSFWLDQTANAARVKYHKIGLKGSIRNDSIHKIKNKILEITNNNIYKENIIKLKSRILINRNFDKGVDIIESFLKGKSFEN